MTPPRLAPKRLLFVTSGPNVPSTRFRILPYLKFLRAAGHRCDVAMSFPAKYDILEWLGWRLSQNLKYQVRSYQTWRASRNAYDSIIIEREVFDNKSFEIEERLRRCTKHLVLDVDDAIFIKHPDKFSKIAGFADTIIAGNSALADVCRQHSGNVSIIPTSVRMEDYASASIPPNHKHFVIGWMGTVSNLPYLSICASALKQLAKVIDFRLCIVSSSPAEIDLIDLSGVNVEFRQWSSAREVDDLRYMDIGLMPLPLNDSWAKYKCGAKLVQYLAVGVPAIATPVGVNAEILGNGDAGRLAMTDSQWFDSLIELSNNCELRRTLGAVGHRRIADEYSIEANWKAFELAVTGTDVSP